MTGILADAKLSCGCNAFITNRNRYPVHGQGRGRIRDPEKVLFFDLRQPGH